MKNYMDEVFWILDSYMFDSQQKEDYFGSKDVNM
jgi:hypothetical protein